MLNELSVFRSSHPETAALDTAISRALLQQVSNGEIPQTFRLYQPKNLIAFGPQDALEPGFLKAVGIARSKGFDGIQRLVGGRAAMFHQGTLAFGLTIRDNHPRTNVELHFQMMARFLLEAFKSLGLEARIGPVNGEYCPGKYSINSQGKFKLAGMGQRLTKSATYIGGVISLKQNKEAEKILELVYRALNLELDPTSFGSLESEVPGIRYNQLEEAILSQFSACFSLQEDSITPETINLAKTFELEHTIPQ